VGIGIKEYYFSYSIYLEMCTPEARAADEAFATLLEKLRVVADLHGIPRLHRAFTVDTDKLCIRAVDVLDSEEIRREFLASQTLTFKVIDPERSEPERG
jgi:hypothetical protein